MVSVAVVAPGAQQQAAHIRAQAQRDAGHWLAAAGHPWARLRIVDAHAVLEGDAPSPADRTAALQAAARALAPLMGLPGVFARLEDGVRVAIEPAPRPPPEPLAPAVEAVPPATAPAVLAAPSPDRVPASASDGQSAWADCLRAAQASAQAQPVRFLPASERLTDDDRRRLHDLQARVAACGPSRWRIEGHTDAQGDPGLNRRLSQRRAEAVRSALVQSGVDPAAIEAVGLGADRLLQRQGPQADARNRRIEVHLSAPAR